MAIRVEEEGAVADQELADRFATLVTTAAQAFDSAWSATAGSSTTLRRPKEAGDVLLRMAREGVWATDGNRLARAWDGRESSLELVMAMFTSLYPNDHIGILGRPAPATMSDVRIIAELASYFALPPPARRDPARLSRLLGGIRVDSLPVAVPVSDTDATCKYAVDPIACLAVPSNSQQPQRAVRLVRLSGSAAGAKPTTTTYRAVMTLDEIENAAPALLAVRHRGICTRAAALTLAENGEHTLTYGSACECQTCFAHYGKLHSAVQTVVVRDEHNMCCEMALALCRFARSGAITAPLLDRRAGPALADLMLSIDDLSGGAKTWLEASRRDGCSAQTGGPDKRQGVPWLESSFGTVAANVLRRANWNPLALIQWLPPCLLAIFRAAADVEYARAHIPGRKPRAPDYAERCCCIDLFRAIIKERSDAPSARQDFEAAMTGFFASYSQDPSHTATLVREALYYYGRAHIPSRGCRNICASNLCPCASALASTDKSIIALADIENVPPDLVRSLATHASSSTTTSTTTARVKGSGTTLELETKSVIRVRTESKEPKGNQTLQQPETNARTLCALLLHERVARTTGRPAPPVSATAIRSPHFFFFRALSLF